MTWNKAVVEPCNGSKIGILVFFLFIFLFLFFFLSRGNLKVVTKA